LAIGLRGKLFAASSVAILALASGAYFALAETLQDAARVALTDEARIRTTLLAHELRTNTLVRDEDLARSTSAVEAWDPIADELGRRVEARVTLFDASGRPVGDSAFDAASITALGDGAASSPEVGAALRDGKAAAARFSTAIAGEGVFAAERLGGGAGPIAVVRVGLPVARVRAERARVGRVIGAIAFVGVLATAVLSALAARLATQGIGALAVAARRMAGGELEVRARTEEGDDLADLGRSLEQLADGLRTSLRELVGERDLLSGVLKSMREGVLLVDRDGQVALINPALREMLLLGADAVGKRPLELVRDSALQELLDAARRSPRPAQGEIEIGGLKPRKLLVVANRLDVEPGALLVVFYDVTDLRRLESLRRDFVANASHELRTPVTSIRSAVETLATIPADDGPARERFLGILDRNAARLKQLVDDLLDLSRIEARELSLSAEPIDLRAMLEHVAELFAERASRTQTPIAVRIDGPELELRADARALEQILQNLVDNALKYGGGGDVVLAAHREDDGAVICVRDHGPGIEARHLGRIFERFYRVDPGRSRQLGGTGLGLAIVKHLVEAMGGEVSVASAVGEGTTFTVQLPDGQSTASSPDSGRPPPRSSDVG
jgi:two-component system phosphate regulon sensor histidine kinase PhoR